MEGIFKGLEKVAQLLLEAQQNCNNQRTKVELVCEDCKNLLKEWEKENRSKILEESKKQVNKPLFVTKHKSDEVPVIKEMMLAENLLLTAKKLKDKHQHIFPTDKTPVLTTVTNIPHKGNTEHSSKSSFPIKDMKRFQHNNVEQPAAISKFRSKSKSPVRKHSSTIHDGYSSSDNNRNVEIHSPLLNIRKKFISGETKIIQTLPTVILSKNKAEQLQQMYGIILLTEGKDNIGSSLGKQDQKKTCTTANTASVTNIDSSVDNITLGSSIPDPSEKFRKAVSYNLQARYKVRQLLKFQNRNEHAKSFQTKIYGTMINKSYVSDKLTDSKAGNDEAKRNLQYSCSSFPNWMWYPSLSFIGISSLSETFAYNSIMEVCQFYSLSIDIQWYSLLLDIFRLIENEVLPYLDKFNLNDSNSPNVFRCLWSILCTEGKTFPILIRKL